MRADSPVKKMRRRLIVGEANEQLEGHPYVVNKKREIRRLRRVCKRGDKARKHMSEALMMDTVTEKDLEITRRIVESVSDTSLHTRRMTPVQEGQMFTCFECETRIPRDSICCPKCGIFYVRDPEVEAVDEGLPYKEEATAYGEGKELFDRGTMAFVHFDMVTGVVTCLKAEKGETDFGQECRNCGAVTQFGIERCPLCGHRFDEWDTGLIGLLDGVKFDLDNDMELDCPACGEHVIVDEARCPSCKEIIAFKNQFSPDAAVLPILRQKDVVFVHLDVLNEELRFAQKVRFLKTGDSPTVHLESIGKSGFDQEWKSIARI